MRDAISFIVAALIMIPFLGINFLLGPVWIFIGVVGYLLKVFDTFSEAMEFSWWWMTSGFLFD